MHDDRSRNPYTIYIRNAAGEWFKPETEKVYAVNSDEAARKYGNKVGVHREMLILVQSDKCGTIKPYTLRPQQNFEVIAS